MGKISSTQINSIHKQAELITALGLDFYHRFKGFLPTTSDTSQLKSPPEPTGSAIWEI